MKFCTSTQNAVFLQHAYILFYSTRCVLNTRLIQWSWCVMIQKRSNTSQCALARRFWTKQSLTHARSFVAKVRRFSAILETFNYHIPLSSGWFDFYLSWEINIWHNMVTQSEFSAAKSTHLSIYNSLNERPARVSFIIAHAGMGPLSRHLEPRWTGLHHVQQSRTSWVSNAENNASLKNAVAEVAQRLVTTLHSHET